MRRRIGRYRVDRLLGHGASAAVYLGRHPERDEQVAIKLFHLFMPEEQVQANVRREVEVIQHLKHPGIIQILEVDFDADNPFFTMPYISGGSLRAKYPQQEQVPLKIVQAYIQQLASILQYAHENKVIHLDVKPENILVNPNDKLLLSDFGIAQIIHTSRSQTTRDPGGTLVYKAPELFRGKPCPASDQYALAITLYEWLCGDPPFPAGTQERLLEQHLFSLPTSLRKKNSSIPEQVENVVLKALLKKPEERFPSIEKFAQAFCMAIEGKYTEEPSSINGEKKENTTTNAVKTIIFGELLGWFRNRAGWTQQQLANHIGRSRNTIQSWENSMYLPREREDVLRLARALRLSAEERNNFLLSAHFPPEDETSPRSW